MGTMGRPRKKPSILPPCMYQQHGAYWYVKKGKWTRLSDDLRTALVMHADIVSKRAKLGDGHQSGMVKLINAAMPSILNGKSPNTAQQYQVVQKKLLSVFKDAEPEDIADVHILQLRREWAGTPNMANRRITVLRQIFDYAIEKEIITKNPCDGVTRLAEGTRKRYITDKEYTRIWQCASPDARVMMDLQYLTGQRIEDVLHMRWSDVSEEGVYVEPDKVEDSSGAKILISMTPDLQAVLDAAKALSRKRRGETILCTVRGGRKYAYETARDMLKSAASRAGVEDFRPNDFRAKCLTDAKKQGLNPQALGGHTTEARTRRYLRQFETTVAIPPKSIRQAQKVLDNAA
jgi:integrase